MATKMTNAIVSGIYPMVEKALSNATTLKKYKDNIGKFINVRSKELYDIAPFTRIYWRDSDTEDFWKTIGIKEADAVEAIKKTYYYPIASFNPRCAKDPFTCTQLMCLRYFVLKKMEKEIELALIYLSFSGSFYPSIHYGSFPKVQPSEYRHVMEYVINNELSMKFDIKIQKSVIGAVKSVALTWLDTYKDLFKTCNDDDVVYLLQQLHNRIKSFMKNIADPYYKIYNDKDTYLAYDSDNFGDGSEDGDFRIADSDSLKANRCVATAMTYITTHTVSYKFCKIAADNNVRTDEIKSIIESIQEDSNNLVLIKELMTILVYEFFKTSKVKEVTGVDFMAFCIAAKPNTKNPNIIRQKEILEKFLDENSAAYRKRKSRPDTKNSYNAAVLKYYTLVISQSNANR